MNKKLFMKRKKFLIEKNMNWEKIGFGKFD